MIYSDGYTIFKNPSNQGGFVITNNRGTPIFEGYFEKPNITNNEMELRGLAKACELAKKDTKVITDSFTAYCWISNGFCKARPDLSKVARQANRLLEEKNLCLTQVKRDKNKAGIYIENTHKELPEGYTEILVKGNNKLFEF